MEKYGCNRLENIEERIAELEKPKVKLASEEKELKNLKEAREDILKDKKDN